MFVTALLAAVLAAPVPKEKAKASYFPMREGDKWVYVQDGKEVTEEVTKVADKNGEVRVTKAYTGSRRTWDLEYLVKDGVAYQAKAGPFSYDPPIRRVDLDLKPGAKWESKAPLTPGVIAESGEMVAGEPEEVEVPAGKFQAVPVVFTVTEWDGKRLPKPTVSTCWYAEGVGLVKMKHDDGEKVLKEFTPGTDAKK